MVDRESFRQFVRLLSSIEDRVRGGRVLILVEGERDRTSLLALGLPHHGIRVLNQGVSLASLAESLSEEGNEVIVLTDWDFTGGRLARRLSDVLHGCGLRVDTETRRRIARATWREVLEVENLSGWAERESASLKEPLIAGPLDAGGP